MIVSIRASLAFLQHYLLVSLKTGVNIENTFLTVNWVLIFVRNDRKNYKNGGSN